MARAPARLGPCIKVLLRHFGLSSLTYVSPDTGQALKESPNQFAARHTVRKKIWAIILNLDDGPNFSELRC
jgi:hypothetical protein